MKVRWQVVVPAWLAMAACGDDSNPSVDSGCDSQGCETSGTTVGGTGGSVSGTVGGTVDGTAGSTSTGAASTTSTSTTSASSDAESSSTGPMLEPSSARHTPRPLGETASPQGYWEYLPPTYAEAQDHPLLVYLHGIGANGNGTTQLDRVLLNGPADMIDLDQWPYERPFVVLSPQHAGGGCTTPGEVQSFLTYAIDAYDVDPARVYLTGLSCGAFGAWDYMANFLDTQIAAALLIAGDGRGAFATAGCALGAVPIWAFHGEDDDVVDPLGTIEPIEALLACEPPPVDTQMTLFPGVRHESWHQVYDLSSGHEVYDWLLSH